MGPSRQHRPEHLAWRGTLLPVDDPWWQTHFTPNGCGCKCRIRPVTQYEYKKLLKTGTQTPPRAATQELDPKTELPTGHRRIESGRAAEWRRVTSAAMHRFASGWPAANPAEQQRPHQHWAAARPDKADCALLRDAVLRDGAQSRQEREPQGSRAGCGSWSKLTGIGGQRPIRIDVRQQRVDGGIALRARHGLGSPLE